MSREILRAVANTRVESAYTPFTGGMDQMTPVMQRKPGTVGSAQNYEQRLNGGYERVGCYERYDGQPSPSDARYYVASCEIISAPSPGETITGADSGATAELVNAATKGYLIATKMSAAAFISGEVVTVGGVPKATLTSEFLENNVGGLVADGYYPSSAYAHAFLKVYAGTRYRADIAAVPGSGNILGLHYQNNIAYALRANAGGTAVDLYKSTASGWSQVAFEYEVTYSSGSGAATIVDGGTLTQGGVTATIRRVLVRTGSLAAGTAAGTMVISAPAGGNFAAGAATVGAGTLTLAGAQTSITLTPGGRFEIISENFGGNINTKRMYGCDGVNPAFEFDGTYFVPIHTGMASDAPKHIKGHKQHLFLSFAGSVQHSSIGDPYGWSIVTGADEIGMGDTVTGFAGIPGSESGGALAIFTRNRCSILYGSGTSDWDLVVYRDEIGAYDYTIQDVGFTVFLDDRGISELRTSQDYGNFASSAISHNIKNRINELRTTSTASCISRDKSQYRLYFSSGYAIYVTVVNKKIVGMMQMLFPNPVLCTCSAEKNDGTEIILFGSSNGMVYQMEKGTHFDGAAVEAYITLNYDFQKSPRISKRYRDLMLETEGDGYVNLLVDYDLGYGNPDISQATGRYFETTFSSPTWDSGTWDALVWDGQSLVPQLIYLEGEAENIAVTIRTNSDYIANHTLTGMIINYTPRRRIRT